MNKIEFYSNLAKFQGRNGDAFLKHYGIIGQKWGQRRWQNADGTFNEAGKERYFGSGKFKPVGKDEQGDKINRNKFAQEYLSRKNISNGHKMFNQMIEDDPEFKKLTDEHWEKEKKFRDDAVKKGSVNSFEHVKILNDYYDKIADLAEKKYGLNGNEKYDFAFHTQGISEEKIHDDSKFKDISKLPVNDTAEDIKAYQEYAKQRREEKIGSDWNKENHMQNFNNWNKIGKKIGIDGSNVRSILESNEDFYNDEAKNIILKNAKIISKMDKALEKNDSNKYMKLRNSEFENDMEKDICEEFIKDKRSLDDFNNTINDANKDFKKKGIDIKVNDYNDYYDKKSHEFKEVYPSDFIKDNNKMDKYKNTINTVKKDYDKINEEMIDKLGDIYYKAFKNTFGYEEHPLTKSEFKKTFGKFDGELKPTVDGNGIIEGSIESKEYGDYGTYYFFEYDLANKIFNYIDEE